MSSFTVFCLQVLNKNIINNADKKIIEKIRLKNFDDKKSKIRFHNNSRLSMNKDFINIGCLLDSGLYKINDIKNIFRNILSDELVDKSEIIINHIWPNMNMCDILFDEYNYPDDEDSSDYSN